MNRFEGKVVIVTGVGSGIGAGTARRFLREDRFISPPSENAEALRWQKTLARYDGFVFVVAEYNSSITKTKPSHLCATQ